VTSLPVEGKTLAVADLRSITDEEAEAQLRVSACWAYILRDPTGAICSYGHGKTRKECENRAIAHAVLRGEEAWPDSRMWLPSKWRFVVWPPRPEDRAVVPKKTKALKAPEKPLRVAKPKALRLSELQIDVLLLGAHHKLDRSSRGWSYDDRIFPTDPVWLIRPCTIKSLHERGLLDANFTDPCVHTGEFAGVDNVDGLRHEHSPDVPKFQVWTSALGIKILRKKGLLPEYTLLKHGELHYH
jgi:hypothetical protein